MTVSKVAQSCPTLCDPMKCSLSGSSIHGIFQAECWSGLPFPSPGDLPYPGNEPGSPSLQADALPSEPPGKPLLMTRKGKMCFGRQSSVFALQFLPGFKEYRI